MKQRKRKQVVQMRYHYIPVAVRIARARSAARLAQLKAQLQQLSTAERMPLSDVDIGKFLLERLQADPATTEALLAEQIGRDLAYVRKAMKKAGAAGH